MRQRPWRAAESVLESDGAVERAAREQSVAVALQQTATVADADKERAELIAAEEERNVTAADAAADAASDAASDAAADAAANATADAAADAAADGAAATVLQQAAASAVSKRKAAAEQEVHAAAEQDAAKAGCNELVAQALQQCAVLSAAAAAALARRHHGERLQWACLPWSVSRVRGSTHATCGCFVR